jgi:uncharacterized membrane protein HdeD (DUF308 family)
MEMTTRGALTVPPTMTPALRQEGSNMNGATPILNPITHRWWTWVLRGLAAILFGILAWIAPGPSLLFLVILFGAYALVDGFMNLARAAGQARHDEPWGALVAEGIVSIIAGAVTLFWPRITGLALLFVIAAWAIVTGIAEIAAAIRMRKEIRNEWLLMLSGLLSVAFGVFLFVYPGAGALALIIWIGAYAVVFGGLLIGLGVRLHSLAQAPTRRLPTGGIPTPA